MKKYKVVVTPEGTLKEMMFKVSSRSLDSEVIALCKCFEVFLNGKANKKLMRSIAKEIGKEMWKSILKMGKSRVK
jgi:hypothetical protein